MFRFLTKTFYFSPSVRLPGDIILNLSLSLGFRISLGASAAVTDGMVDATVYTPVGFISFSAWKEAKWVKEQMQQWLDRQVEERLAAVRGEEGC